MNRRRRGLTLIETVVAVGLLSSVAALLVPTLSKTREDAKRLTCQSHLGQTGRALLSYRADLGSFPLFPTTDTSWSTWSFGGWSGRNRGYWESLAGGVWNIQTNERPLTVYMTPWQIPDEVDPFTPTQEAPLFKCPSDNLSAQWQWGGNYSAGPSAYDDVGTSYQMNFNWWEQVNGQDCPPDQSLPCWPYKVATLGGLIYEKYLLRQPDRFITLMEDPASWGLGAGGAFGGGIQVMGYHGEWSTHMAAFADGHAEYFYMDTRHLHDSPHNPPGPRHGTFSPSGCWTVCDETQDHTSGARHQTGLGGMPCER
ncbi:MAG: DUF1559 domain-containing protein [Planctomycetes bacterium]|nr:DUF1559 domain-containing protein [Planctomycetota bacterium]